MGAFLVGGPALENLVHHSRVAELTVSASSVAGRMMPIGAPLFVADGIFFGLPAFGKIIASTAFEAIVVVVLISSTPLGQSLDGIWWAIGAMLVAPGLVLRFSYRRALGTALRS